MPEELQSLSEMIQKFYDSGLPIVMVGVINGNFTTLSNMDVPKQIKMLKAGIEFLEQDYDAEGKLRE